MIMTKGYKFHHRKYDFSDVAAFTKKLCVGRHNKVHARLRKRTIKRVGITYDNLLKLSDARFHFQIHCRKK